MSGGRALLRPEPPDLAPEFCRYAVCNDCYAVCNDCNALSCASRSRASDRVKVAWIGGVFSVVVTLLGLALVL